MSTPSTLIDEAVIEGLQPQQRRYDVPVTDELVLAVLPNGAKTWTWLHDGPGRPRRQTLGVYPDMSLAGARAAMAAAVEAHRRTEKTAPEYVIRDGRIESVVSHRGWPLIGAAVVVLVAGGLVSWWFLRDSGPGPAPPVATEAMTLDTTLGTLTTRNPAMRDAAPTAPPAQDAREPNIETAAESPRADMTPPPLRADPGARPAAAGNARPDPDATVGAATRDMPAVTAPETPVGALRDPGQTAVAAVRDGAAIPAPGATAAALPDRGQTAAAPSREQSALTEPPSADRNNPDALPVPARVSGADGETAPAQPPRETAGEPALGPARATRGQPDPPESGQSAVTDPGPPRPTPPVPRAQSPGADVAGAQAVATATRTPATATPTTVPGGSAGEARGPREPGLGAQASEAPSAIGARVAGSANLKTPVQDPRVARAAISTAVVGREPVDQLGPVVTGNGEDLQRFFFFTELRQLAGQRVRHRWIAGERLMADVPFEIGEAWRWRVYSSKQLQRSLAGDWSVQVILDDGTVLYNYPFVFEP